MTLLIVPHWATDTECDELRLDCVRAQSATDDTEAMTTLRQDALRASKAYWALTERMYRLVQNLRDDESVQLDCSIATGMRWGAEHTRHADAELEDGSPNHTPHRTHVALLYLTNGDGDDHVGGDLIVRDQAIAIEKGLLVTFPATAEYMHEVTPVTEGERWNLAVWTKR